MVVLCLLAAGCAHNRYDAAIEATHALELVDTPFFPQDEYQCGPAALATVLSASGSPVSPEKLRSQVYLPERRGSLQVEMLGASRRHGRLPYLLDHEWSAIELELNAGRPVLVLQNLGLSWYPVWHYGVVIGFDPTHRQVILRSGTTKRRVMGIKRFMRSWAQASYWAAVILTPGQEPVRIDRDRYLRAVTALEASGQLSAAESFYQTALLRWPDDPLALFGLANIAAAREHWPAAEARYGKLLDLDPEHAAARNNLAYLLLRRGCRNAALDQINTAMRISGGEHPLRPALEETHREILAEEIGSAGTSCPQTFTGNGF